MFSFAGDRAGWGSGATTISVAEIARRPRWLPRNRDQFWRAVDAVTAGDAAATRLTRRIERKQRQLQSIVGEAGWRAYVDIEELQAQRTLRWLELGCNMGAHRGGGPAAAEAEGSAHRRRVPCAPRRSTKVHRRRNLVVRGTLSAMCFRG